VVVATTAFLVAVIKNFGGLAYQARLLLTFGSMRDRETIDAELRLLVPPPPATPMLPHRLTSPGSPSGGTSSTPTSCTGSSTAASAANECPWRSTDSRTETAASVGVGFTLAGRSIAKSLMALPRGSWRLR
jgi:hypothetical protein